MGIKKLTELIENNAPRAIRTSELKHYEGRVVAIDASTSLYQFLIAINPEGVALTNAAGETTSHLQVTRKQNEECMKLLTLMGVPIVQAPCEAEAQCAELCKAGKAWATGSEDMDSLTLGATILLRRLSFAEARKLPIMEFELSKVLEGLELTHEQFIDLCIILGCDFCDTIKGIGPKKGYDLIKKHGTIEEIIKHLDKTKYPIPDSFPFEDVRELFKNPLVIPGDEVGNLEWKDPDTEELTKFLVEEMGFAESRVANGIEKLKKHKSTGVQTRIDSFFSVLKRPREEEEAAKKKKQKAAPKKAPAKKAAPKRR
eukprot:gene19474-23325_t